MQNLYPLRFHPICKPRIWGGQKIASILGRGCADERIGESWEISGLRGDLSVVENGYLKDNQLEELLEVYMTELVGEKNYAKYGIEFPLLVKYIDAQKDLSIQVHPDNKTARERHNAYGKTEMWYILEAEKGAVLYLGFQRKIQRGEYLQLVKENRLTEVLHKVEVKAGDLVLIEPGTVHSIGAGILLAEIQQSSDITYRIYDWGRKGPDGKERELHTSLAEEVIDFKCIRPKVQRLKKIPNSFQQLIKCDYFETNRLVFDTILKKDYYPVDSFVILLCVEGSCEVVTEETGSYPLSRGNHLLLPASIREMEFIPKGKCTLLEILND